MVQRGWMLRSSPARRHRVLLGGLDGRTLSPRAEPVSHLPCAEPLTRPTEPRPLMSECDNPIAAARCAADSNEAATEKLATREATELSLDKDGPAMTGRLGTGRKVPKSFGTAPQRSVSSGADRRRRGPAASAGPLVYGSFPSVYRDCPVDTYSCLNRLQKSTAGPPARSGREASRIRHRPSSFPKSSGFGQTLKRKFTTSPSWMT